MQKLLKPFKYRLYRESLNGGIMGFFSSKRNQRIIAAVIALVVAAAMVVTSISFF